MTWINNISDSPNQCMILSLASGDQVTLNLSYLESQKGWFYSVVYGSLTLNNRRLVASANMLRAFRDLIPFGF
jgi:hypothetical protein